MFCTEAGYAATRCVILAPGCCYAVVCTGTGYAATRSFVLTPGMLLPGAALRRVRLRERRDRLQHVHRWYPRPLDPRP
eukprot:3941963-Rhodomonas_salina.2